MKLLKAMEPRSIEIKIAVLAGLCLFATTAIIIIYAAMALRGAAIETAQGRAISVAESNAHQINEEIEIGLDAARLIAQTLAEVQDSENPLQLSREQVSMILRGILEKNPQFVGVYTLWEPGAFDTQDADFADQEGHDETGRFMVYWSRSEGTIAREVQTGYDEAGVGRYYLCPKQTRMECVTDPYLRPVQGNDVLVSSLTIPIIVNGQFYGIAGVDIKTEFFQTLADNVTLYDQAGMLSVITHNGTIAAATGHADLIGEYASALHPDFDSDNELERLRRGEYIVEFQETGELEIYVPMQFGRSVTLWSVSVIVPGSSITADATQRMWWMIGIGAFLTLLALALLWLIAHQIAAPIKRITQVARQVSGGNLDVQAPVTSKDETGLLADVFNQMVGNLRQTLQDNRQAQDELVQQNSEQRRLLELVEELETPAIPLAEGLLFAPLVGTMDSRRAQTITARLLQEVHMKRTRHVILDITGVVTVDTQVAHALIHMVQALRLLGCKVTMTGISAEIAATLTQLGIKLDGIHTVHSPQDVLRQVQWSADGVR
jgi:methyl-accepting chemotaxis protein